MKASKPFPRVHRQVYNSHEVIMHGKWTLTCVETVLKSEDKRRKFPQQPGHEAVAGPRDWVLCSPVRPAGARHVCADVFAIFQDIYINHSVCTTATACACASVKPITPFNGRGDHRDSRHVGHVGRKQGKRKKTKQSCLFATNLSSLSTP